MFFLLLVLRLVMKYSDSNKDLCGYRYTLAFIIEVRNSYFLSSQGFDKKRSVGFTLF